jgi:anti-sigma regulatory factor (Ser/Thr protein kinase)
LVSRGNAGIHWESKLMENSDLAKRAGSRAVRGFKYAPELGAGAVAGVGLQCAFVQLYFAIPSTESGIASAIKAIKESMQTIAMVDDWIRRAELSLQEALPNGHYHGNGGNPGKELRVGCLMSPSRLEICIEDDGVGYHSANAILAPDPNESHGRGLFLIHQLMDRVAITANGSRIVMYLGRE